MSGLSPTDVLCGTTGPELLQLEDAEPLARTPSLLRTGREEEVALLQKGELASNTGVAGVIQGEWESGEW